MPDYLLEIGVEELPASFVASGLKSLAAAAKDALVRARLEPTSVTVLGTPRRLGFIARGLPDRQEDRSETVTGPPWSAAFRDGEPTRAALGFAQKNGVEVADLQKLSTDKGDYVTAHVSEKGKAAAELLSELLPEVCARISFPKQMRWGAGEHSFGRPIHWLVSLLGEEVVPFTLADIVAGNESRGHRFLSPDAFAVQSASAYVDALRSHHVFADTGERRRKMKDALEFAAAEIGGELAHDEFLLDECASLVEEPFVVPGRFDEDFLSLPEAVVVSVMRDHQRYFAVRDLKGALLPRYLNVVNTANARDVIAKGNDRVLRARLADARFFVEEDRKQPLEGRLAKLDTVVFQRKLGTIGDKVRRIEQLAGSMAAECGADVEKTRHAARLAKTDLESLIVFEFPELQGQMGRYYAEAEGIDAEVTQAIAEHYQPASADDAVPTGVIGSLVGVADRLDTLVGCFGIGQQPSGSADPFALRRAALGIIRIALHGEVDVDLERWSAEAYDGFEVELQDRDQVRASLDEFFRARLRAHYAQTLRGDVVDATLAAWHGGSVRDLEARMVAVDGFRERPEYEALATAFKRAFNIAKGAERGAIDQELLEEGPEAALASTFGKVRVGFDDAIAARHYTKALALVASELRGPIDTYFDEVYVMVEDEAVRANRLRLLASIADTVSRVAHFHLLAGPESTS